MATIEVRPDPSRPLAEQPELGHNRWHPDIAPVASCAPGDEVVLGTLDALDGQITASSTAADVTALDIGRVHPLTGPIDVQGAELDVLAGATETLRATECVVLEVSFFEFFHNGPLFHDVIAFMRERGFVAYDIFGFQYRPLDGALSQVDVAFVRETGEYRKHHFYATREQREQQDRSLKQHAARARTRAD